LNKGDEVMIDKHENQKAVVHEVDRAELAQVEGGVCLTIPITDGCGNQIGIWHGKGTPPPPPSQAGWFSP
jgi:hypothetical protein